MNAASPCYCGHSLAMHGGWTNSGASWCQAAGCPCRYYGEDVDAWKLEPGPAIFAGWSWGCPCGWASSRFAALEQVERARAGHLAWHTALREAREQARA